MCEAAEKRHQGAAEVFKNSKSSGFRPVMRSTKKAIDKENLLSHYNPYSAHSEQI